MFTMQTVLPRYPVDDTTLTMSHLFHLNIKMDATILDICKVSHYLGVWVDDHLTWNANISQLIISVA